MSRSARDGYGTSRQLTPIPLSRADADPRNVLHEDDPSILVAGSSLISRSSSLWKGQPRPFHGTAEDGELLPKSDILESQLATSLEGRDESANKRRNHAGMVLADRRLIKFGARG